MNDSTGVVRTPRPRCGAGVLSVWIGYWAVLFLVMHVPVPADVPLVSRGGDKLIHFLLYFVLVVLGETASRSRTELRDRTNTRGLWRWAMIYAAYGVLDEILQPLVGRTMSVADWVADLAGIGSATLLVALRRPRPIGRRSS